MVSDEVLAEAVGSLLRESNPRVSSFNDVVRQLQSKLGLDDLSHKAEFIGNQIQLLLRPQPPPELLPTQDFASLPHQLPPLTKTDANSTTTPTDAAASVVTVAQQPAQNSKESAEKGKKRRGGPGGLNKLCGVSPLLQPIVGNSTLTRTEIVQQLWAYIRKNNLQDPSNKRIIICNDELRLVFETDCTDMFKMNKLLAKHIIPLEPSKQTSQKSKKLKTDAESGSKNTDSVPIVIISEALANFFGTDEREMSQVEVLKQVLEYIKVNQLEDPSNGMAISCDAKLQELLGCRSISAFGIPEILARHHLFKRP